MNAAEAHLDIQRRARTREEHHFLITTDGSGWDAKCDGTGSAWILRSQNCTVKGGVLHLRGGAGSTSGSVQRAEMQALLDALQALSRELGLDTLKNMSGFCGIPVRSVSEFPKHARPTVWWVGDREAVILQVARKPDGTTYYERRTELDLWVVFDYYANLFDITPVYTPRNTTEDQKAVDDMAGNLRDMFNEMMKPSQS